MATKRKTEAERALIAFESRFKGVADWHNKVRGTGLKHGPGIEVKRKGGPRPAEFETPLPNDTPMSIAQSAFGQYPRELRGRERRELVAQDAA